MIRVGRVEDVPVLEGRSVAVGDRRIAVFRTAQGFHALDDACPHRGGPLADGLVADSCVTCPLHGWRFELRSGAALGAHPGVAVHEVLERDGELWVRLAAAARAA
ncbi:MAG: nitrite reductase small subunit NirD [Actinomycetota bacterium]|nr:nitrite reductase small subunit NirD [Actinomycetota bacterium]